MANFILSAFADEAGDSLKEQIAALKANDISLIEPRSIDGKGILTFSDNELADIERELSENGIKVGSLGSPIGKYEITESFDVHLELFKKALNACKILKTDKMRMFSFFVKQDELAKYRDEVIARLRTMVSLATDVGGTLCHENESAIYGQMPAEVRDILTNVEGIKGIFDPANYRMNDGDIMDGINATLINLSYLHIKDACYSEQAILPAGEGEGRIADVLNIVDKHTDDTIMLTIEPHLFKFMAYANIDAHELKGKYSFNNNRESFDFAVNSLKKLLINIGYREENGIWKK